VLSYHQDSKHQPLMKVSILMPGLRNTGRPPC
jgi:hypothetical protein